MAGLLDSAMDRSIVLGYSRIGWELRHRRWPGHGRLPGLEGHTVAISGATSGVGRATAIGLWRLGAQLRLLVRSVPRGEALASELRARTGIGARGDAGRVEVVACDLSDLGSVREAAAHLGEDGSGLDVLINNAGAMPPEFAQSADGIELTVATNLVGPFLLTNLLAPALAAASAREPGRGRVITVSSGGAYGQRLEVGSLEMTEADYQPVTAYARSKRAEIALTELWAQHWDRLAIGAHVMHPGWADTPGVRESLPRFHRWTRPILRTPAQGADTILWLTGADAEAVGSGGFWHDRERRPPHLRARTREDAAEREALWSWLCERSGWQDRRS